jgi:hypothetical protein
VPARRYRKLTAAGILGFSAAATGLLAPTSAYAGATATDAQWDRVAQCESGDNWHINSGNGYYGGLQLSEATWKSYDARSYAARPDLASRLQQIDIANHVLANEGWGAWPSCPPGPAGPPTASAKGGPRVRPGHRESSPAAQKSRRTEARPGEHIYVVQQGDTLFSIARSHHVKGGWKALYARNRAVIGPDPQHLRVGTRLAY